MSQNRPNYGLFRLKPKVFACHGRRLVISQCELGSSLLGLRWWGLATQGSRLKAQGSGLGKIFD
jgi:hypothetical protein